MPLSVHNTCPKCGRKAAMRALALEAYSYSTRCVACHHFVRVQLPRLRKAIISLDQNVLSNLSALINPDFPSQRKSRLPSIWATLLARVQAAQMDQIACFPLDEVHRDESRLSRFGPFTLKFGKALSDGAHFASSHSIICQELTRAVVAFYRGTIPDYTKVKPFEHDPHEWSPHYQITIEGIPEVYTEEFLRNERERVHESLRPIIEGWRSNPRSFEQVRKEEAEAFGPGIHQRFVKDRQNKDWVGQRFGDASNQVRTVLFALSRVKCPSEQVAEVATRFLQSQIAAEMPTVQIRSTLYAHESALMRAGMKFPKSSLQNDLRRLVVVLQYSDAILMERHFADALVQRRAFLPEGARRCRVFSTGQIPEFIAFLEEVRKARPESHYSRVRYLYPKT